MKKKFKILITGYVNSNTKEEINSFRTFLNKEYKEDVYAGLEEGGAEFAGVEEVKITKISAIVK